jgi:hypothetical protein
MAGAGLHTSVDHHQVAVVDPVLAHAIAAGPHVEGADRVGNQGGLDIQALTQRTQAEGHRLANRQVGQDQTSKGGSTAVLLLVRRGGLAQLPASGQGTSFISPTLFQVLHLGSASR